MKVIRVVMILGVLLSFESAMGQFYGADEQFEGDQQFQDTGERRPPPRREGSNFEGSSGEEANRSGIEQEGRGGGKHCNKGGRGRRGNRGGGGRR